jgi:hypothetical protein
MDLEALALAVDELVRLPAADRATARLYGVRLDDGDSDGPDVQVRLEELAQGDARQLPLRVRPPAGLFAIALAATAWAAPMDDGVPVGWTRIRPSRHPQRRRAHTTVLVGGEDCEEVSVLRYADGEPQVLRGGVGLVHERLIDCWSRRARPSAKTGETSHR